MGSVWMVSAGGRTSRGRMEGLFSCPETAREYMKKKIQALQEVNGDSSGSMGEYPFLEEIPLDTAKCYPYFVVTVDAKGRIIQRSIYFQNTLPDIHGLKEAAAPAPQYRERGGPTFQGWGLTYAEAKAAVKKEYDRHREKELRRQERIKRSLREAEAGVVVDAGVGIDWEAIPVEIEEEND